MTYISFYIKNDGLVISQILYHIKKIYIIELELQITYYKLEIRD